MYNMNKGAMASGMGMKKMSMRKKMSNMSMPSNDMGMKKSKKVRPLEQSMDMGVRKGLTNFRVR